tara:strand:- start:1829 stop:2584 length:756 start_codon:yes stop_codon:yes gene_type:complete
MDNILNSIPNNLKTNSNLVEIRNKLTFGDINIKNLKLNSDFNHIIFDNLHGNNINISPIKTNGILNIFQFNNYNTSFSFKVNHFHNVKENYTKTDKFFENIKKLEKQMENYNTGLHIKCFKNLTLENFDVTNDKKGEQIIYFKNCVINKNLTINCSGRSLIIIDNSSISNIFNFNMSVKHIPMQYKKIVIHKKKANLRSKADNLVLLGKLGTKLKKQYIPTNTKPIIVSTLILIFITGFFYIKTKKNTISI